jgi:hypothetical protein
MMSRPPSIFSRSFAVLVITAALFGCGGAHSVSTPTDHRPTDTAACSPVGSCATDADCAAGSACVCETTRGVATGPTSECLPSGCRVDADCGAGHFCSLSLAPGGPGGCGRQYFGYYCHGDHDECGTDADCLSNANGNTCTFVPERGLWACTSQFICAG